MNDVKLLKTRISKLSPIKENIVRNLIGKRGVNDADGWVRIANPGIKDRALWLPTATDFEVFGKSQLKKVYRFYVNDNPPGYPYSTGGTGLVRLNLDAGTIEFIDSDKYEKSNENLTVSWGRTYKVAEVSVFTKKFLENQ